MDYTAPAKVNLYLKVLGKRDDGYHNIDTIFERISLADVISVNKRSDSTVIVCSDSSIAVDEDSLLGKVVASFKEHYSGGEHFHIEVKKNIPVGAGLGGGSSDAAVLLRALNENTGSSLSDEVLLNICSSLGADIPFFYKNIKFGYGTARGDKVREITTNIELSHILINPGINVSTKAIYGSYNSPLPLTNSGMVDRMFSTFLEKCNTQRVAENLHNDLQTMVLQDFPEINKALEILNKAGALGTLMSGSGPTVFGLFDKVEVCNAYEAVKKELNMLNNWKTFLAYTY